MGDYLGLQDVVAALEAVRRNQRIVQGKLREIARHLGIPDEQLPRERVYSPPAS